MRLTVSACGATDGAVSAAAGSVVEYLMGPEEGPALDASTTVQYHADSVEGPGAWLGSGAKYWGLDGRVEREEFKRVLEGRHPGTGARLVTARGSAGRHQLRTGTFTVTDAAGAPLYGIDDAAAALGQRVEDFDRLVEYHATPDDALESAEFEPNKVHAYVDPDANAWVTESELARVEQLFGNSEATISRLSRLDPKTQVDLKIASDILHLSPSYLRRIADHYDIHKANIDAATAAGDPVGHAYLKTSHDRHLRNVATGEVIRSETSFEDIYKWPTRQTYTESGEPIEVPEEWITSKQAAEIVGCSPRTIRRWIVNGDVDAVRESDDLSDVAAGTAYRVRVASLRKHVFARDKAKRQGRKWKPQKRRWVTVGELIEFTNRRVPPSVTVGYDLTLTTEKSVSLLGSLGDDETRDIVVKAIDDANAVAIDFLERQATWTRRGRTTVDEHGASRTVTERVATEGLTVASFLHGTSRNLDPFLHRHNVVANCTADANGDTKTLDATAFYRSAPAAAALASAHLRSELSRQLGVSWVQAPSGAWEIEGIPAEAIEFFSSRGSEISDALAELGVVVGPADRDRAALATRDAKRSTTRAELIEQWTADAAKVGLDQNVIADCFGKSHQPLDRLTAEQEAELHRFLDGAEGVCETSATFNRVDVIQSAARWRTIDREGVRRLVLMTPAEVERQADRFLASARVVPLALDVAVNSGDVIRRADGTVRQTNQGEPTFSTRKALARQRAVLTTALDPTAVDVGVVPAANLAAVLIDSDLSDEQRGFVTGLTTTTRRTAWAIGAAGAGKTHSLRYAADAWKSAGYKILGATVSGQAQRELGEVLPDAVTIASLRTVYDTHGRNPLDAKTVLVVDEAGTVSDADMAFLTKIVNEAGAALRLIGDPAQHTAVGPGGLYATLCERPETIHLTSTRRVKHEADREAAARLRGDGAADVATALEMLKEAGHLVVADTEVEAYRIVLERWLTAHNSGQGHPIVEATNAVRRDLNDAVQKMRISMGELKPDRFVQGAQGRRFHAGDQVVAKNRSRDLHPLGRPKDWLRNGTTGTVRAVNWKTGTVTVDFDGLGTISIPASFHSDPKGPGLDLGYAVTSHGVQGATLPASTSILTDRSTRAEVYVDLTRGVSENVAVVVDRDNDSTEFLPRPEQASIEERLLGALDSSTAQIALMLDPSASRVNDLAHSSTPAELAQLAAAANTPVALRAAYQRALAQSLDAVGRQAVTDPDDRLAGFMPPKPEVPYLARQWETALAHVARYRATWEPNPARGGADVDQLLGAPAKPDTPQVEHRQAVADLLVDLAVDIDLRAIADASLTPEETVLTRLDSLGHTVKDPVPEAEQAAQEAAAVLDALTTTANGHRETLAELARTLATLEAEPLTKRARTRAQRADLSQQIDSTRTAIGNSIGPIEDARQTAVDAQHHLGRARNDVPTSPQIAAREAFLRRQTAVDPPGWAVTHLERIHQHGRNLPTDEAATLLARAAAYRERWNITDPEEQPAALLGPPPGDDAPAPQVAEWTDIRRHDPIRNKPAQTVGPSHIQDRAQRWSGPSR